MNRWLARFAFSFFVVAAALAWEGYRGMQRGRPAWQGVVTGFAVSAAVALGVVGTREKHRAERERFDV